MNSDLRKHVPPPKWEARFFEILTRRFLPALSFTYVIAVLAIACEKGAFFHYFFEDRSAYLAALPICAWISMPALLWMFLRCLHFSRHQADDWYKIISGLMILVLLISEILLPEINFWGLKLYLAASLPMFIVMYVFLVKEALPAEAAYPMTVLGLACLVHGAAVHLLHG